MSQKMFHSADLCPVCGAKDVLTVAEIEQMPVHCNLLWTTHAEAMRAPKGDIRLEFCRNCTHVFNSVFDPTLMMYAQSYENSLHFSPHFQSYVSALAAHLIDQYDLRSKHIVEIGCGQGEFLRLLCDRTANQGIGFDPSYTPDQAAEENDQRVTFVRDFFSERYADKAADLICCRHVLEHIHAPRQFLLTVRRAIGERCDTVVYFEVPNALFMLRDLSIWDIIYEHCSYFNAVSLSHLFESCHFGVCRLAEEFDGQFLAIESMPSQEPAGSAIQCHGDVAQLARDVETFGDKYRRKVDAWNHNLERLAQKGQRVVVWGAGSKGVTFLNTLKSSSQIEYVIDVNQRKQGMYIAGTGQQIVGPQFLRDYRPDVVIVMNAIYRTEIRQFTDDLGVHARFIAA